MNRRRKLATFTALALSLVSTAALAFEVRSYNEDSKTYHGTFNCKGVKTPAEIRPGTTSLSTNEDGPCELTLDNGKSITVDQGDKIRIKNGELTKAQ
ncbi:MAG TPA: hypothetical protein VLX92_15700 [Kofleriaceae bacterium]|nr:hypothetical protein [Kofleriaceae bacterium]